MTDPHTLPDDVVYGGTLYGEISIGTTVERENVASAIMNRVEADIHGDGKPDWWGEGVKGVCLNPAQFSCWNFDDPNRERILRAIERGTDPVYLECLQLARAAIAGKIGDTVNGATHYHTIANILRARTWPPKWTRVMKEAKRDSRHVFYLDPTVFY